MKRKHENNMNFGPRVGLNGWGGPNIGKQVISRTFEFSDIVPQPILRTRNL